MTEPRETSKLNEYGSEYIDVRDVAEAIVATLQTEKAGGERFILDAGKCIVPYSILMILCILT